MEMDRVCCEERNECVECPVCFKLHRSEKNSSPPKKIPSPAPAAPSLPESTPQETSLTPPSLPMKEIIISISYELFWSVFLGSMELIDPVDSSDILFVLF